MNECSTPRDTSFVAWVTAIDPRDMPSCIGRMNSPGKVQSQGSMARSCLKDLYSRDAFRCIFRFLRVQIKQGDYQICVRSVDLQVRFISFSLGIRKRYGHPYRGHEARGQRGVFLKRRKVYTQLIVFATDNNISRLLPNEDIVSNLSDTRTCFALGMKWRCQRYRLAFVTNDRTVSFYARCKQERLHVYIRNLPYLVCNQIPGENAVKA